MTRTVTIILTCATALLLITLALATLPRPVTATPPLAPAAAGGLITETVDVVLVLDKTGSMEFDTICYGCWERCDGSDCPAENRHKPYPKNGTAFPLDFETVKDPTICGNGGDCSTIPITPGQPRPVTGTNYIILEAELYANNTSIWDPSLRGPGQGYWAMQRSGSSATSADSRPAFVRHHPYLAFSETGIPLGGQYSQQDAENGIAPRLEYDFIPTWNGSANLFIRAQAFSSTITQTPAPNNELHWSVGQCAADSGTTSGCTFSPVAVVQPITTNVGAATNNDIQGDANHWQWLKLGSVSAISGTKYTLWLFAGGTGYGIDRLIVADAAYPNVGDLAGIAAEAATPGSAQRVAADRCNPVYGLTVTATDCRPDGYPLVSSPTNHLNDPLFSDTQPVRGMKEAAQTFIDNLDPTRDQVGIVTFDSEAVQAAQLESLRAAAARAISGSQINDWPLTATVLGEFDETECCDAGQSASGTQPIEFQLPRMAVEDITAGGSTDIADGLRRGLHMLGVNTDDDDGGLHANDCQWTKSGDNWLIGGQPQPDTDITSHCHRVGQATPLMVLITDGPPTDGSPGDNDACKSGPIDPLPYPTFPDSDPKFRCTMYYAQIASNHGVSICTIGLGSAADPDLLGAIAAETNGHYFFAPSPTQLELIFDHILLNGCQTPTPPESVTIHGPITGTVGQVYTFTAAVSPITATRPLTYVWQPEPLGGQGTATTTYRWGDAGTQTISVTVSNLGGSAGDTRLLDIDVRYYFPVILKS